MLRLLITGGGGAGSGALERLWAGRYVIHFSDADESAIPPAVPTSRRHSIPMAGPAWVQAVSDLCRRLSIDVLIPTVDEELPLVPAVIARVPALLPLIPSAAFVTLMRDKYESMQALLASGIDAPRTVTIDRAAEIGFPCLVKPRDGRGSRGVQVLTGQREVDAYLILSRRPTEQLLAQELLVGEEWTVYVAADRNKCLRGIVPVRVDVKRGVTLRAETAVHEGITAYCSTLHRCFPTAGAFNVQLMATSKGRLAAFEINPRVSTTLCLALAAGADPVADLISNAPTGGLHPFVPGMRLRRNWDNYIEHVEARS